MDYFQGVVTEYLRADRAMFVNTEYLIQLEPGNAPAKNKHWYCDAVAVNMRDNEVSYVKSHTPRLLAHLTSASSAGLKLELVARCSGPRLRLEAGMARAAMAFCPP